MMKRHKTMMCLLAGLCLAGWPLRAAEGEAKEDRPARAITVAFQYPGITLDPDDSLSADLLVRNRGRSDETVLLDIVEQPADWEAQIKRYGTTVQGVFVAGGQDQTLTLSAKPKSEERSKETRKLPPGTYRFVVQARTEATPPLEQQTALTVTVQARAKGEEKVSIETSYPELRGPADDRFVFSLDIRNDTDQDAVFNFKATAPPGWETSFKPAYEQKQIVSLQINANSSRSVEFQVNPPYNAQAGEYDFHVEVQSPKARAGKDLKVVITGTYALKVGTPSGLLSLVTEKGRKANVSLLVQNRGSAAQSEISFEAFKPENWEVKFEPEKIKNLEPGAFKQVEMTITPADQALVGDYSVSVEVQGEKAHSNVEFRVTIKAATTWGWIGVGIIVLVILGLAVAFKTLGRR